MSFKLPANFNEWPDLHQLFGGALNEHVKLALIRAVENIQDPNATLQKKRSITIKIELTPDAAQSFKMGYSVESKLSGPPARSERYHIADEDGEPVIYSDNPNQTTIGLKAN